MHRSPFSDNSEQKGRVSEREKPELVNKTRSDLSVSGEEVSPPTTAGPFDSLRGSSASLTYRTNLESGPRTEESPRRVS